MRTTDEYLRQAGESADLDFKREFDPASAREWCEIVKDIVAIANSGGGAIIIGVQDDGTPSAEASMVPERLDPATIADKVSKYVHRKSLDCAVEVAQRQGTRVLVIRVPPADPPLVFEDPGTYEHAKGEQRSAFGRGTMYFRHGAKSETATNEDIERAAAAHDERERKRLLEGITRVVQSAPGSTILVRNPGQPEALEEVRDVRLVNDPNAPEFRQGSPDDTHPFRQKELVAELNKVLPATSKVNGHDVQCARKAHNLDANPTFVFASRFGSRQFSKACCDWMLEQSRANPAFFADARAAAKTK